MFGAPCKCCGPSDCPLFVEDFTRADTTTPANGWTENTGDFSIVSNEAKVSSSNARMTNSAVMPAGAHAVRWQLTAKGESSNDHIRLFFGSSTSNYAELTVGGSATLAIVVGGSPVRSCTVTAAANTYHTIDVLICGSPIGTGDSIVVMLNGSIVMWGAASGVTIASVVGSIVGGLGTGTISVAAHFDDFKVTLYRGINEIQRISKTSGTISGGTWDINDLPGSLSVLSIPWNVSAAALQTSMDAAIGAGNSLVTGSAFAPQSIQFVGIYKEKNVAPISVDGANLTGSSPVIAVSTFRDGYGCTQCRGCSFVPGSKNSTGNWNSVSLVVASAANAFGTTGCPGFNGTYNLDKMSGTDCTGCSGCSACQTDECICYGIDGLSIAITDNLSITHTITGIRFCGGILNFITSSGIYLLVAYGLNAANNNIWPLCNDMTTMTANGTQNRISQTGGGFCTGWTFTVSDGG